MGGMTVDTAAEGNVDWPLAYQHLWDRYLALGEALDEERERVRVLTEALRAIEWEQNGDGSPWRDPPRWFYCPSCGNVKNTREEVGIHTPDCALAAALAAAKEETGALWAE